MAICKVIRADCHVNTKFIIRVGFAKCMKQYCGS